MPGYIDNSSDLALFESYSQGRQLPATALAGQFPNLSEFAQWSSVLDKRTCDWCEWADEKVFNHKTEPYDPPTHHGCRCLIAYISKDEFPPSDNWGVGPPKDVWPPGSYKVQNAAVKANKVAPKPSGPLVGTVFEVDSLKTVGRIEDWLFSEFNIETDLFQMGLANAQDVGRAIEKFMRAYPEFKDALFAMGTQNSKFISKALRSTITDGNALAAVNVFSGQFVSTNMVISSKHMAKVGKRRGGGFATDAGHEGTVWHELGHVAENWQVANISKADAWSRQILADVYGGDSVLLATDISKYALKSGHELLAEFFHIANQPKGLAGWATSAAQEERLRKMLKFYNDNGMIIRESQLP